MKKISLLIVPLYLIIFGLKKQVDWSLLQWIVAIIISIDIRNGMITNIFYSFIFPKDKKIIQILHAHTIVISIIFAHSITWGVIWYAIFNFSVWFIDKLPKQHHRFVSIAIIILAIGVNVFIYTPPMLFEWLIPMLFINNLIRKSNNTNLGEAYGH
ncbi:hypothetical protein [Anaeromicrobium sediminis]|uniref:Uncharacterized protein n=1 Tax=Anaeromicrobium sediminis TaxID=1478221 RepID=A0A267MNT0_9FIRM|nr:hypothetical protein [Anaeromicrobium sediminis]PAB60410.1 hypothetical protein CCE28_05815 [Anaeromicrobium sediminis]